MQDFAAESRNLGLVQSFIASDVLVPRRVLGDEGAFSYAPLVLLKTLFATKFVDVGK
jgi:hypothetical protein